MAHTYPILIQQPYLPTAMNLEGGATGYYKTNSGGIWDGTTKQFTIVMAVYLPSRVGVSIGGDIFFATSAWSGMGYKTSGGGWSMAHTASDTLTKLNTYNTEPGVISTGVWHGLGVCIDSDGGPGDNKLIVDGTSIAWDADGMSDGTTFRDHMWSGVEYLGATAAGSGGQPCYISHVWAHNVYYDLNANWSKFFSGTKSPKYLGADGSLPFGVQPKTYFPIGDATDNKGSLGNWDKVGTVNAAPSSPT